VPACLLTHVNTADGIYKLQNISKTITVLAKTPLLTLKLMMCWVASYQIYTKIFVLKWRKRKLFGSFTAFMV